MLNSILIWISGLESFSKKAVRFSMFIVLLWIGSLKFFAYEADGIVPFIANSPFMSFLYKHPADYLSHVNKEGELVASNRRWHVENRTYIVSEALGIFLLALALSLLIYQRLPLISMIGSMLIFLLTIGTLSFLISTPETWVTNAAEGVSGFPFLSGRGRLVVKDVLLLAGAIVTMSESAQVYLLRRQKKKMASITNID